LPENRHALVTITYRKYVLRNFGKITASNLRAQIFQEDSMTQENCHEWRRLAEAARDEQDSQKLMDLIQQLNRALDEHAKESRSAVE
jgi:hypothetical protein